MLSDTSPHARRFYYARLAELSAAERIAVGMELTEAADQLTRAAVRRRFPEAEGDEFEYQVLRLRYGRALADKVHGR